MLARYQIRRGASLADLPRVLREGVRIDTRMHTRHCLRPARELVATLFAALDAGRAGAWTAFARAYQELLDQRFAADRAPFDALAVLARTRNVFLGCSCPTARVPDVRHCHTVLALRFLRARYPRLDVRLPKVRAIAAAPSRATRRRARGAGGDRRRA